MQQLIERKKYANELKKTNWFRGEISRDIQLIDERKGLFEILDFNGSITKFFPS